MSCGLIKDLKTRYLSDQEAQVTLVVVWLKIWKHDIKLGALYLPVKLWFD